MKKLLFSISMFALVSGASFAQKSAVKDAKSSLESKSYADARTSIKGAETNQETMNDPDTWKLAGDIENAVFDAERTKQLLKKAPDEKTMYEAVYATVLPYSKADSLGELPDAKGKTKNKVRKDIASILKANLPYFINGGVYYNDQKDFKRATDFFETYLAIPKLPCFEGQTMKQLGMNDTTVQTIKYYAVLTAVNSGDKTRSIRLLKDITENPFVENPTYKLSTAYELLANSYVTSGDTAKYVEVLKVGAKKFPESQYFTPYMINYLIQKGKNMEAIDYLDQAIANNPSNACQLYSVKASIYGEKNNFATSDSIYKTALEKDPNCERALEGLAVSYIVQAQNLKDASSSPSRKNQVAQTPQIIQFYNNAYPLLEKFKSLLKTRNADQSEVRGALVKLQNVYYNLSLLNVDKSKELKAVEAELGGQ